MGKRKLASESLLSSVNKAYRDKGGFIRPQPNAKADILEREQARNAIMRSRDYAKELHELSERQRCVLDDLDGALRLLRETDREASDLDRYLRRIERLHELRRSAEYGSMMVELERSLDEYWRRLSR